MYYTTVFRIDEKTYYSLWFSDENDKDQFLTNDEGVVFFLDRTALNKYILENKMDTASDETLYDVNMAINWMAEINSTVDCEYVLTLWNIITDLAYSINRAFLGDSTSELTRQIYDKLFWGNNLPAMRGDGEIFIPRWSPEEIHKIQMVVADCINIIRSVFLPI